MTHSDPNDPRFTAKALGENENQPIDPEAQAEFESLQDFAQTLKAELKTHSAHESLTAEQQARVQAAIQPKEKKLLKFPVWMSAIAACLVLGLVGIFSFKALDSSKDELLSSYPLSGEIEQNMPVQNQKPGSLNDENTFYRVEQSGVDTRNTGLEKSQVPQASRPKSKSENDGRNEVRQETALSEEPILELSPFAVVEDAETGYLATSTLAGNRMRTELPDVTASVSVVTQEILMDAGASASSDQIKPSGTIPAEGLKVNSVAPPIPPQMQAYDSFSKPPLPESKQQEAWNREAYDRIVENSFKNPKNNPLSTFSIDVDTASYANVRRFLNSGQLPPVDAVRIEELVNYFSYDYAEPDDETPFAVHIDSASAPWKADHRLVRIGLQGKTVDSSQRPDANLVFLIDVSGSMSDQNKLPLVQRSLNLLVEQMEARDRIAVVVYAGASGLALPSTTANNQETIQHAISNLKSGGSTNGGAGIELAYSVARRHFVKDGINRVILCTDGDFNVGATDRGSLTRLVEEKAKSGVFFSVLGFGMGNYQDASMEELSNKGNGNYGYIDSFKEARKVFVDDMLGTLFTIAKDVKIQVEFNPAKVASYRLLGYENRILAKEDFNDDTKDAGEIGAGHSVTALYEVIPAGIESATTASVDPLKYQRPATTQPASSSAELLTVKLRYKQPDEDESQLLEHPFMDGGDSFVSASEDFRFATSVAAFGMLLRKSEYTVEMALKDVRVIAIKAQGNNSGGLRSEFLELVEKAINLSPKQEEAPAGQSR